MDRIKNISFILVLMIFPICLIGCGNNTSTFTGSKTGNDTQFLVDFDVLNSSVDSSMPLSNGDKIDTTIDIENGKVDILVENENGTVIYRGDDVENGNFTIEITESGNYTFYVTGDKAKGSVHFVKVLSNDIATDSDVKQEEPIIWYSDLTHDGIDEKIVVDVTYVINYPATGEEETVSIYSGSSDELIWTGHADTVHVGWNGIYIYNDGKNDYLLLWQPTVFQDIANFNLRIFSLTEEGKEKDLLNKKIEFVTYKPKDSDIGDVSEFVDMVNGYLEKSYVLVDTDNGAPVYSTADNKIINLYDVSSMLDGMKASKENN
ncbi:hypothetical protein [Anaerosporobacter sp.]